MVIVHTFQYKSEREAIFASITNLTMAPKWLISFAFNYLSRRDTQKIHIIKLEMQTFLTRQVK